MSDEQVTQAIQMQNDGMINQNIADNFGVERGTLLRYISKYKRENWGDNCPLIKKYWVNIEVEKDLLVKMYVFLVIR